MKGENTMKIYDLQNYITNRTATVHKIEEGCENEGKYCVRFYHQGKMDWDTNGEKYYKTEKSAINSAINYISKEIKK